MFHRYLMLGLLICFLTGCEKETLTEDQKKIRQELTDQGITIHGQEVLDVNLRNSEKVTPELLKKMVSFGRISYLNLDGSNVTDECLAILKDAKSVETLWLTNTSITDAGLEHVANLQGLIILHLPETIGDAGFKHLAKLTTLRTLTAEKCQVTDAGMTSLESMSELRWLKLNGTNVGNKGLDAIKDITSLHTLELINTKVTDRGLLVLSGLSKLNIIELTGCDVSDEAVIQLRKELPETEIINGMELDTSEGL